MLLKGKNAGSAKNTRKRVGFLGNNGFFRLILISLLALGNIAFGIVVVALLSRWATFLDMLLAAAAIFIILHMTANMRTPDHTLAWAILLLVVPAAGLVFYFSWGKVNFTKNEKGFLERSFRKGQQFLMTEPDNMELLREKSPELARQANVLHREGFPVYIGADATYYPSGEEFFEALFADLERAVSHIFMCYYIVTDGQIWSRVRDILCRKAREGVTVRFMYDDMGCVPTLGRGFAARLREDGVQVTVFNPIHRYVRQLYLNYRNHQKMCVIDGRTAYVGGANLADEYANINSRVGHWKDGCLRFTGDAVRAQTIIFLQMWDMENMDITEDYNLYLPESGGVSSDGGFIIPFADGPSNNPRNPAHTLYQSMCATALESIWYTTPYLTPDCALREALCCAAESGVDVRILTPGIPDHVTVYAATRGHYQRLLDAGVRIFEYTPGFMHAKTVLCDRKSAVIGSVNMDSRSFYQHYENAVWLTGGQAVQALADDLEAAFEQSREIDPALWSSRPIYRRAWQGFLSLFSPLF